MKRKTVRRRRIVHHRVKPRRLHHRVISFFRGDGGIYVIFVLATVMAGAFALTGGVLPQLNPNPPASDEVTIDPDSSKQSSESALQLVDIKVKPTATSTPTPNPAVCYDKSAVAIVVDVSGSMDTVDPGATQSRMVRLKDALSDFLTFFNNDSVISLISFSGTGNVLVSFDKLSNNKTKLLSAINSLSAGGSTNMKGGLADAKNQLDLVETTFSTYNRFTVFMTDGVPESGDCKFRKPTGVYHYYQSDEITICTIAGTTTEPTMFTHKWSPIDPANQIKADGVKIFSIAMFQPSTDPAETNKNNQAESLMKAVSSNTSSNSMYYVSNPTTKNLTSTYREIARKICPSP